MNAEEIARELGGASKSSGGWKCCCPAHDDKSPSLSIADANNALGIVFKCHAGCSQTEVLMELRSQRLLPDDGEKTFAPRSATAPSRSPFHSRSLGDPAHVYDYRAADGRIVQHVLRYEPPGREKEIRQCRPDGEGKIVWKSAAAPLPLYRLPELLKNAAAPVLVVEGEKCADAAAQVLGAEYAVTTWAGGVDAVAKTDLAPLHGRRIVLWPDADEPGRAAMAAIARKLSGNGAGARITLIEVDDLPEGWDVADAIAEGWGSDEAQTFIEENAHPLPAAPPSAAHVEKVVEPSAASSAAVAKSEAPSGWPPCIDLVAMSAHEPQAPQFIVPDWLPVGYATLFAGHGGVGKSAVALHLAVAMALGLMWAGLQCASRRVLYVCCEDREGVLHWRLSRICRHLGISISDLAGKLDIVELVGHDAILWERDPRSGNCFTPAFGHLAERVRQCSTEVLIIDGITDTYGGSQGSAAEVKRYVNALLALIPADRGAVLLIGHVNRATTTNTSSVVTTEGYLGTVGWHNAVRSRWYFYPETESDAEQARPERTGRLQLELQKAQFSRIDTTIGWRWDDEAHMFLPEAAPTQFDRRHLEREEQRGILLALKACADANITVPVADRGKRACYMVLAQQPDFPASLRGNNTPKKRIFYTRLETLRQLKQIEDIEIRRKNRHGSDVLMLTTEGARRCAEFGK